jgi:hypothetical protein
MSNGKLLKIKNKTLILSALKKLSTSSCFSVAKFNIFKISKTLTPAQAKKQTLPNTNKVNLNFNHARD